MTDWNSWAAHVEQIVKDRGRWFGLCDGDGVPLFTLPVPMESSAPEAWMSASDVTLAMPARGKHVTHQAVRALISEDFARVETSGEIRVAVDGAFILAMADRGPNGIVVRRAAFITHAVVSGENPDMFDLLTIHGVDEMDVWSSWPCPSWPLSWWLSNMAPQTSDISGTTYDEPREMTLVEMAKVADGYTKFGPAAPTIRELVQESLDVVASTQEDPDTGVLWVDDPGHVVEVPVSEAVSPKGYIRVQDGTLWETVSDRASQAGVVLGCRLWWPGDPAVRSWELANSSMTAAQIDLSPATGSPHRRVINQSFEHPVWVLTAEQSGG